MTTLTLNKTGQALVDDARAAGFKVKVTASKHDVVVEISTPGGDWKSMSATIVWEVQNVAPNNSRLGFPTTYKPGFRFGYASARNYRGEYVNPKSVRQVRGALGLPVA